MPISPELATLKNMTDPIPKSSWNAPLVTELLTMPFMDLLAWAHDVHARNFDPHAVQVSTILNYKTGGCPESCKYCAQSAHWNTDTKKEPIMTKEQVKEYIDYAKGVGATRLCLGAAFRQPREEDLNYAIELVQMVNEAGMESCCTLGMLTEQQAKKLEEAGLDYYNHNLDTSEEFYEKMVTTRTYKERLDTLDGLAKTNINICSGGILGLGETIEDRAKLLMNLRTLPKTPLSITINKLIRVEGTPYGDNSELDSFDLIRGCAAARILFPTSFVRLTGGRKSISYETQAMCIFAGVNSVHIGQVLLTRENQLPEEDAEMFKKLNLRPLTIEETYSSEKKKSAA